MSVSIKPKPVSKKSGTMQVVTKFKGASGAEKIESSEEPSLLFDKPFCDVTVMGGQTVNVGNYNSVRFSVAVRMPCTKKDLDSTYEFCKNYVDDKMQKLQDEVKGVKADAKDSDDDFL